MEEGEDYLQRFRKRFNIPSEEEPAPSYTSEDWALPSKPLGAEDETEALSQCQAQRFISHEEWARLYKDVQEKQTAEGRRLVASLSKNLKRLPCGDNYSCSDLSFLSE